jgi:hypothetical protein
MNSIEDMQIAGRNTVRDWKLMRARLDGSNDEGVWNEAFEDFFRQRLDSRYFSPIRTLERLSSYDGEGFAIVTLQCSLIEFLASTLEGKTYRHRPRKNDPPLGKYEYSESGTMFTGFLVKQLPFGAYFQDAAQAEDFYRSVRCGLLHEARTKNGWRIRTDRHAKGAIDTNARIVYRHKMREAFDAFTHWYGEQLRTAQDLQAAFIRKFDSLCAD